MQKILVIDDEELFRQATACALQRKGFETLEAADGIEGADFARRLTPDLIICANVFKVFYSYSGISILLRRV